MNKRLRAAFTFAIVATMLLVACQGTEGSEGKHNRSESGRYVTQAEMVLISFDLWNKPECTVGSGVLIEMVAEGTLPRSAETPVTTFIELGEDEVNSGDECMGGITDTLGDLLRSGRIISAEDFLLDMKKRVPTRNPFITMTPEGSGNPEIPNY